MKDNKDLDDEYSILNIHKTYEDAELNWKTFNNKTNTTSDEAKKETQSKLKDVTFLSGNKSLSKLKEKVKSIQNKKKILDTENISCKRYKECLAKEEDKEVKLDNYMNTKSEIDTNLHENIFQKAKQDTFVIEEVELSDFKDNDQSFEVENKTANNNSSNYKKDIKKGKFLEDNNILKDRLSRVVTPRANVKFKDVILPLGVDVDKKTQEKIIKNSVEIEKNPKSDLANNTNDIQNTYSNITNTLSTKQVSINKIKKRLNKEINKTKVQNSDKNNSEENAQDSNLISELKSKIDSIQKLRKNVINLENFIGLQKVEIEMIKSQKLPANNSAHLIQNCKKALSSMINDIKMRETELKNEIVIEKHKNAALTKEVDNLKKIIDNLVKKRQIDN
ncbi:hypothetical protein NCER_100130 [Vairimorpha ceranae BRL01]|uniref:Uncharacterized protein n=2 Tax=Vairimorpha ceranae TaxID=40302 RepID=C4V6T5_VAIC1|nr:hypothetical protein AAJ76_250007621 [Vairimorpha ceranae]EEQ83083.1 hypothetical protein NCER_100130 [Vairimorpha ceranae BRL01]KAF5140938.1 hypothetical protein G9O61_00g009280 [Vairimorpha ceranae]KKO75288.1 hypothetical protein AAJ76_250007621 [Vairimorpha ceranae]